MQRLFIGLFLALLTVPSYAQKSPLNFGKIPMEDMEMTAYDKDTSAAAVILADYGESYVQVNATNATLNFERHIRIKILKKDGLKWADASIPLFHTGSSEEKVSGLKASTYNLEGSKIVETKMSKDGIFNENFNRNISLKKFTLPNVKEGSVIEYSYTIISEFITNFPNWKFQHTIPTRLSEYWAVIPEFFVYEKYTKGYLSITDYEIKSKSMGSYMANSHHWKMKDAPAFKEEPFMTSEDDYLSQINFAISYINFPMQPVREIMGSWNKLSSNLLESESFGGIIQGSNFLKKQVEELTQGLTEPTEKIVAIHNYVKQTIEWNGQKDFTADNLKKIIELKKGTSGDINLLLASMLEKAAISVEMVLLSTRDHGFVRKEFPMQNQFNYTVCLVRIGDKTLLLDATEKFLPINVLPEHCLNGQGLIISKYNQGWINLDTKVKARTVISAEVALNKAGELKGKLNFLRDGYDAKKMRKDFTTKGQELYLKDFLGTKTWQVEKSDFQNISEIDQSAKEIYDLSINDHVNITGDVIYINPFIVSQVESNPFIQEKREYPVDFGTMLEKIYIVQLTIPDGYKVDEVPQSKIITLPGNSARYIYNVSQRENVINITSNFQVNKNLFIQDEYPNLREFYNIMIAKQSEQIVLKKK
jgi:hypothetical protein